MHGIFDRGLPYGCAERARSTQTYHEFLMVSTCFNSDTKQLWRALGICYIKVLRQKEGSHHV